MSDPMNTADTARTDGDLHAQDASANEAQLQQSPTDASIPAESAGGGAAEAAGAEGTAAGEGAPAAEEAGAAQTPDNEAASEAGAAEPGAAAGDGTDSSGAQGADKAGSSAEARAEAATARLADAMVRAALQRAGVPEGRAGIAARLMDVAGVDPLADSAAEQYAAAAQRLVTEIPEFVPAVTARTTGASGEHPRKSDTTMNDPFMRGFLAR